MSQKSHLSSCLRKKKQKHSATDLFATSEQVTQMCHKYHYVELISNEFQCRDELSIYFQIVLPFKSHEIIAC